MTQQKKIDIISLIETFKQYKKENIVDEFLLKKNGVVVEEYLVFTDAKTRKNILSYINKNYEMNTLNNMVFEKIRKKKIPDYSSVIISKIKKDINNFFEAINNGDIVKLTYYNEKGEVINEYADFTSQENFCSSVIQFVEEKQVKEKEAVFIKRKDPYFGIEKKLSLLSVFDKDLINKSFSHDFLKNEINNF